MQRALIVLNGRPPGRRLLKSLCQQADIIAAADGGSTALIENGLPFHVVIGDLDSTDQKRLGKRKVELVKIEDQNHTDFEKALGWVLKNTQARDIIFTGGMGDDFDYVLTHLSIASKYADRGRLRQVEDTTIVHFVTEKLELNLKLGAQVSLLGLSSAEGITTEGLKWRLKGETLQFGVRDGLHNVAEEKKVRVGVRDGCLAIVLKKTKGDAFRW